MRRSLFACSALALALTLSACQQGDAPVPETTQTTTEAPAEAIPAPTQPVPPATTPTATPAPVSSSSPVKEPQASIPEGPDMAPRPVPADDQPCSATLGAAEADRLARVCRNVSPATRPPCNVANPCGMIQDEIDRSCALWERDGNAPADCKATRP